MRKKIPKKLSAYRIREGKLASNDSYGFNGAFSIPFRGRLIGVIASDQQGWDHVSVSLPGRIPTWTEMCYIKDLFFDDEEIVIQYHPPKSKYINDHDFVLHLWRKHGKPYELPPAYMV